MILILSADWWLSFRQPNPYGTGLAGSNHRVPRLFHGDRAHYNRPSCITIAESNGHFGVVGILTGRDIASDTDGWRAAVSTRARLQFFRIANELFCNTGGEVYLLRLISASTVPLACLVSLDFDPVLTYSL